MILRLTPSGCAGQLAKASSSVLCSTYDIMQKHVEILANGSKAAAQLHQNLCSTHESVGANHEPRRQA